MLSLLIKSRDNRALIAFLRPAAKSNEDYITLVRLLYSQQFLSYKRDSVNKTLQFILSLLLAMKSLD